MRLLTGSFVLGLGLLLASCSTNTPPPATLAPPPAPAAPPPAPPAARPAPVPPPAPAAPAPSSVSGPGAQLFAGACGGCHGLDTVTSQRHDLAGWKGVVQDMVGMGASLTDAQADQVAAYLAANYGPGAP